jgi:DNA-binding IclR family transcriptional regulator
MTTKQKFEILSSLSQGMVQMLENSSIPLSKDDFVEELNCPPDHVRVYIARLIKMGYVSRVSRGRYALSQRLVVDA